MNKKRILGALMFSCAAFMAVSADARPFHFGDQAGEWWSARSAAMYAGLIGGGIGCLGGLLGAASGLLASRGKGRWFVTGSMMTLTGLGFIFLAAGIVAALTSQPYHVAYPLLLLGVILSFVCGPLTLLVRRRYVEFEMRQMRAKDC
jgi:MFS family permease